MKFINIIKQSVIIALIALICSVGVFLQGCSIFGNKNKLQEHRYDISREFNINIPQEWECLYYNKGSLGGWHGDGTAYYVFSVTERDEEFFSDYSEIKNEEFEESVDGLIMFMFKESPINTDYMYDFNKPYEWFCKYAEYSSIRIIYQTQKLHVFASYS